MQVIYVLYYHVLLLICSYVPNCSVGIPRLMTNNNKDETRKYKQEPARKSISKIKQKQKR
jgi:hypothetical protein